MSQSEHLKPVKPVKPLDTLFDHLKNPILNLLEMHLLIIIFSSKWQSTHPYTQKCA